MIKPRHTQIAALSLLSSLTLLPACVGPGAVPETVENSASNAAPAPSINDETPVAPAAVEPMSCNHNGSRFHCKGWLRSDVRPQLQPLAAVPGLGPTELQQAYALNATLAPTSTIAIVDAYNYPNAEADLGKYRANFGLPACTVANGCLTIVNQNGDATPLPGPAPAKDDWTVETALDLDMASAACPSCKLLLIQANDDVSDGLMVAQAAAAKLGAVVVSNSWGGPESTQQPGSSEEHFFKLTRPVAIFVAAGDDGYDDGGSGPDYPSVSAYAIAVGGTTLARSNGTTRGWTETAWSTSQTANGAGGSSCSVSIPKPSYQASLATQCNFRAAADLAAVGDPATGVAVYNAAAGGFIVVGGTSAASPFVAGVFARYGLGGVSPDYPYTKSTAFFDVTAGRNGTCGNILCNAGTGWDGPTGVGTPNGALLAPMTTSGAPDMAQSADMARGPEAGDMAMASSSSSGNDSTGSGGANGSGASSGGTAGTTGTSYGGGGSSSSSPSLVGGCNLNGANGGARGYVLALFALFGTLALRRRA